MRANKIARQKEVRSAAVLAPQRKENYDLWEACMREVLEDDGGAQRGGGRSVAGAAQALVHGGSGRLEIADHSMIVNAEARYARKEVQRPGGRKPGGEAILGKG
ncbi:hypothetical protein P8C59_000995 [Phyllachora maydis]|nr:hypothetical protein P8C59_000995 [Phyllachora maydis]